MVGVGDGDGQPPQKRQRIEDLETAAALNNWAQNNRQNRWMQGYEGYASDISELLQTPQPAGSQAVNNVSNLNRPTNALSNTRTAARHSNSRASSLSNVVTIDLEEGTETVTAAPASHAPRVTSGQERPLSRSSTPRMAPHSNPTLNLVQYESPGIADPMTLTAMPSAAANGAGRKSVEASARSSAQPGLPSPAPSDENNNSPTFSEIPLAAMRNRSIATPRVSIDTASGRGAVVSASASPGLMQHFFQPVRQSSLPNQQQNSARPPSNRQQQPVQAPPPQQLPSHGHQQRRSLPSNNPIPPYTGYNVNASGQPLRTPPTVPSHSVMQPPTPAPPRPRELAASRIPMQVLLHRINAIEKELGAPMTTTDVGRLTLLSDAVKRNDWFYQLLSQIYCLRTTSPSMLPKSIKTLDKSSWAFLGYLLCENSEVNETLVKFFSEFPEPIMDIYSDPQGAREVFESRAKSVSEFLIKLPQHWDGLVALSRQRNAPPLVQDMDEILKLKSVVLQTTCFRAIARQFWGLDESLGIKTLESVHLMDQNYYYNYRNYRDAREKHEAYVMLNRVFQVWKSLEAASHSRGQPILEFPIPKEVEAFFMAPTKVAFAHMQRMQQAQQSARQLQSPAQLPPQSPVQTRQDYSYEMLQQRYQQAQQNGRGSPSQMQIQSALPNQPHAHAPLLQQHQAVMSNLPSSNGRVLSPRSIQSPLQAPQGSPQNGKRPLFPTIKEVPRAQPTHVNPNSSGIHQAPLRSPMLGPAQLSKDAPRLYRHVIGYALRPTRIKRKVPVQTITFNISADTFANIAKTAPPQNPGEPSVRVLEEGMLLYRLRCAVLPSAGYSSESAWAVADNIWPEEFAFELNDVALGTRRKLHHGRYLPIDLTAHLKQGKNKLKVFVDRVKNDKRKARYSLAVETIGVTSHASIVGNLIRVSAKDSISAIKKTLAGDDTGDDDDIAVTSSSMTIKLYDPYSSSKLVDIPVRGQKCLHKDVFDLEIFLNMCKREQPGWPTVVDCWRCPLCRGDVRPQTLVIDEFLVEVIADLKARNLSDTRAIVLEADGSWKPKAEERTGVRSPSLEREMRGSANRSLPPAANGMAPPPRPMEIIELD
ncbi:E3 SUMO-protein ligase SIZ2 [Pseudocercospora fuligena]|uniref:E3 SUMO-protein ligase SIZ2 n=1 Tax=Pseudocercospora fuligena TaxID=685502 RepID=A0A8H6RTC7_9PEZI|nr:E3 SUMO-protein ligase SIZ2 [Pseudocercospora fuligena]